VAASPTILCFENHRPDGYVWALRHRGRWHHAKELMTDVSFQTVYRGKGKRQPVAYLTTTQPCRVVIGCCGTIVITRKDA